MTIGDVTLKRRSPKHSRIEVTDIGVKKFRLPIRKKKISEESEVYRIKNVARILYCDTRHEDQEIMAIEKEFFSVFRDDLPDGLPPKSVIDRQIEIQDDGMPPQKPMFQLSPAEVLASKE